MFGDKESILKVLSLYNPWWRFGEIQKEYKKPIKRKAYYQVKEVLGHRDIRRFVLLTGARRVGKTTILYQEIENLLENGIESKNILYVSFDNPILKFNTLNEIVEIYKNNIALNESVYLFLDEIQYSKDWNNWLKVLYDTDVNVSVVATGSASPIISKGVVESGTGRWVTVTVPTLSFYEYCLLKEVNIDLNIKISDIRSLSEKDLYQIVNSLKHLQREFNRYITVGGFPELVLANDERYAQRILREDIVDKVLKRDIPELYNIRNIAMLEKVFLYLCFNSSNIINYTNMCQLLDNASLQTVQEYIRYLESANLIYINEPIYTNGTSVLKSKPKIYIVDAAIRNAVLMREDILTDADELGYVVETVVFRHVKTYYTIEQIGYYRDGNKENREIDVIVKGIKNNKFIEVKYRERTNIDSNNPIYELPKNNDEIYIVTKNDTDYSIKECENGNKIIRIPAFLYLYLLGKEEYENFYK